jgi:hypothetical protein
MKRLAALIAAISLNAQAEFYDGNALYEEMRGTAIEKAMALGYIMGAADAFRGISFCPQDNVTSGQLNDMVRRYLIANPDKRHYSADSIVIHVISGNWPCPKKGKNI